MSRNHFYGNRVDEKGDIVNDKKIKIGGATGFWGETDMAMPQFFTEGDLNYIVFDYLAEITMSIWPGRVPPIRHSVMPLISFQRWSNAICSVLPTRG